MATRSRDQLDRTLHLVDLERHRLLALEERHLAEWQLACGEGATWLARAAVLAGRDGIRLATAPPSLSAQVHWGRTAGVTRPVETVVTRTPAQVPTHRASSAVGPAAAAYDRAVAAGAALATVQAALRHLDRRAAVTRRRLRGLDKRWIPRLEQSLRDLDSTLEQAEREDGARLRGHAGTAFGP